MKIPFTSSIGSRIFSGFLVLLAILFLISWIANSQMKSIEELVSSQVMEKAFARHISQDIILKSVTVSGYVKDYLSSKEYTKRRELRILIKDELRTMSEEMSQAGGGDLSEEEKLIVGQMRDGFVRYNDTIDDLLSTYDNKGGAHPRTVRIAAEFTALQSHFLTVLLSFDSKTDALMYQAWDNARNRLHLIKDSILILSIMAFAAAILLRYLRTRSITRPISRLVDVLERYGNGEHDIRSDIDSRDEIGFFANRFNAMLDQLQASHQRLADIINFLPDPTFVIDDRGRVTAWNRAIEEMTGVSARDILGRGDYSYAVPFYGKPEPILVDLVLMSDPAIEKKYFVFDRKGQTLSGETLVVYPDGKSAYLFGAASPLFDRDGNIVGAIESLRDITSQKLSEKALRESEERFRTLAASAQDAIIILDERAAITYWNDAAARIFGYSGDEVMGRDVYLILAPGEYYENFRRGFENFRKGGDDSLIRKIRELEGLKKDGSVFPVELSISALMWRDTLNAIGILRDITDRRKLESQFIQSQKMEAVGTLAGGIAHDFNNMLAGIMGSLSILKYKLTRNHEIEIEELQRLVSVMDNSGTRAVDIVQQLLTLSRRQEMTLSTVDLNRVVRHVMKICGTALDKSIVLEALYFKNMAVVRGDENQLEQILLNLCINAGHAMTIMRSGGPQGGVLGVEIRLINVDVHFRSTHPPAEEGNYWVVSVRDTGVGMDEKTVSCIFDPFFTTKERGSGTGLGLAMVYNSVKQHNGFIDVYSEVGIGTTVNIYFPVYRGEVDEGLNPGEEIIPHGAGLILVVDDEESVRMVARSMLEECGYKVMLAADGEEGVRIFREVYGEIVCVILDMVMPKKSGKDAFMEMRQIDPEVKVLLASGFRQDERVEAIMNMGASGFIQKPYSLKKLADVVHGIIYTS